MEARQQPDNTPPAINSIKGMIDEAKRLSEQARRRTVGTKFMSDLIGYITAESKRKAEPEKKQQADNKG